MKKNSAKSIGGDSTQVTGDVHINNHFGLSNPEEINKWLSQMYPAINDAAKQMKLNSLGFISLLNAKLYENENVSEEFKFTARQMSLILESIKNSAKTDSTLSHNILSDLVVACIARKHDPFVDLVLSNACQHVDKLDENLIKILAFKFIIRRCAIGDISDFDGFMIRYKVFFNHFESITVSRSMLEYLESSSCGHYTQFPGANIYKELLCKYQRIFETSMSQGDIDALRLTANEINNIFIRKPDGEYIFKITSDEIISDWCLREKYRNNQVERLFNQQKDDTRTAALMLRDVPNFNLIEEIWNDRNCGLCNFTLNSVGVAIAITYLNDNGLGVYDYTEFLT